MLWIYFTQNPEKHSSHAILNILVAICLIYPLSRYYTSWNSHVVTVEFPY